MGAPGVSRNASAMSDEAKTGAPEAGRRILFVRSGGGTDGLDRHAGMWLALEEAGIRATANSGTSAGAAAAAADSLGWSASRFAETVGDLTDADIRDERICWKFRLPWISHIWHGERIRKTLDKFFWADSSSLEKPLAVWAARKSDNARTDVASPKLSPTLADAVRASMATPLIFPAVKLLDVEDYIDGGVRFNLPLVDEWRGFDEVWLLIASGARDQYPEGSIVTEGIGLLRRLMADQVLDVLDAVQGSPLVRILWPPVEPQKSGMLRFDHSLVGRSYEWSAAAIRAIDLKRRGKAPDAN
jgi:predicted acylesterase/phospholipase RssA